jgi:mannose-6-phosphate isomerase-like protein (cupin superfamily)
MRQPIFLKPEEGRRYSMGPITAIFKADGSETDGKYSISEWWLEPHTCGPGAHSHEEDDVFFVIEGEMYFLIGDKWLQASKGDFILAPSGITHDFENRSDRKSGVLNLSAPGNFEQHMLSIVAWFKEHPPKSTQG